MAAFVFCFVFSKVHSLLCNSSAGVFLKTVLLKSSPDSQKNTCVGVSFFNKVAALRPATLLKKRLWHKCFPANLVKFSRSPFLQNTTDGCFFSGFYVTVFPFTRMHIVQRKKRPASYTISWNKFFFPRKIRKHKNFKYEEQTWVYFLNKI